MAYNTVWQEKVESRPANIGLSNPEAKLVLYGVQTPANDDDTDANLSLLNSLPLVYPGYYYAALTFARYEIKNQGGGLWYAEATYTRQDALFTDDTGGGTQKVTQALAQRGVYGPAGARYGMLASLTSGSPNVFLLGADTTANLAVGMAVADSNGAVPAATTIASITDSTHLQLSNAATKTTGLVASLMGTYLASAVAVQVGYQFVAIACSLTNGSTTAAIDSDSDDTSEIVAGGSVSGPGVPNGTTVASITDDQTFTLSAPATASGTATLTFQPAGSTTAALAVGMSVSGKGVPAGATVAAITDATHFTLSVPTTAKSNPFGALLQFGQADYLSFTPAASPPPDFKGAINVKDDSVEGVDVEVPAYHWEETYHVNPAIMTWEYRRLTAYLTGSYNADVFRGFQPGEVKFLGRRGSQKGLEDFEATYRFAASPNRFNFQVGAITVASKLGWDYLWVRYQKTIDGGANVMVNTPQWVVVDQVLPMVPFASLGIAN